MNQQNANPSRIGRPLFAILLFSVLHLVVSFVVFMFGYESSMARFDTMAPPSFSEKAAEVAFTILWSPGLIFARFADVGMTAGGWPVLIANSLLWGTCLYYASVLIIRRQYPRFSLKTALILLTVASIGLAIAYQFR